MRTSRQSFLFIIPFLCVSTPLFAQWVSEVKSQRTCNELNAAAFNNDTDKALDLMYPDLFKVITRDQAIELLHKVLEKNDQFQVTGMRCEPPIQTTIVGSRLFALLPVSTQARVPGGTFQYISYYLGISDNAGSTWTFLFMKHNPDQEQLQKILPGGIGNITIPPEQQGNFIPDTQ